MLLAPAVQFLRDGQKFHAVIRPVNLLRQRVNQGHIGELAGRFLAHQGFGERTDVLAECTFQLSLELRIEILHIDG